ncbi:7 transmembrane sweet-taste receptor of 3 GCPR-domain-containing protein [Catenaria anguillulae PL171]|uniref:7 transmembrane sweet-taste receptor of 3 GCPR-domain-containing protein n=1 Tax=Catenaria anguillulae PL171 TaxID=765915 RepID=A0A1Y2HU28_9FUNG|nr:7 transmembrane sweet-taste receptor of 3 GCPR-domain-containing protein [Catenaria anguillulae PL171]
MSQSTVRINLPGPNVAAHNWTLAVNTVLQPLAQAWSAQSGINIEWSYRDAADADTLAAVRTTLSSGPAPNDIYLVDVTWPSTLQPFLAAANTTVPAGVLTRNNQQFLSPVVADGKVFGIPFTVDFGALFYRTDLLQRFNIANPPKTWDELDATLNTIIPALRNAGDVTVSGYLTPLTADDLMVAIVQEWIYPHPIVSSNRTLPGWTQPALGLWQSRADRFSKMLQSGRLSAFAIGADNVYIAGRWAKGTSVYARHWLSEGARITMGSSGATWAVTTMPDGSAGSMGGYYFTVPSSRRANGPSTDAVGRTIDWLNSQAVQRAWSMGTKMIPSDKSLWNDVNICNNLGFCSVLNSIQPVVRPTLESGLGYSTVSLAVASTWLNLVMGRGSGPPLAQISDVHKRIATVLEIDLLGPPVNVTGADPLGVFFTAMAVIGLILSFLTLGMLFVLRKRPKIKRSSPVFMAVMVLGLMLGYVSVLIDVGIPNAIVCAARPWVLAFAMVLTVTTATLKNVRIYLIFQHPFAKRKLWSNKALFTTLAFLVSIEVAILGAWTGLDAPVPTDVQMDTYRFTGCMSKSASLESGFTLALYVYHAVMLAISVWVAAKTWSTNKEYSEARSITTSTYVLTVLALFAILIGYVQGLGVGARFALIAAVKLVVVTVFLLLFFGPKLWYEARAYFGLVQAKDDSKKQSKRAGPTSTMLRGNAPEKQTATTDTSGTGGTAGNATSTTALGGGTGTVANNDNMHCAITDMSVRSAKSEWRLQLAPWRSARAILYPSLKLIVLEYTDPAGMSKFEAAIVTPDSLNTIYMREFTMAEGMISGSQATGQGSQSGAGGGSSTGATSSRNNGETPLVIVVNMGGEVHEWTCATNNATKAWADAVNAIKHNAIHLIKLPMPT